MNGKQIGLGIVLAGFLALTGYTVLEYGYIGFFKLIAANAATVTAAVDLVIALTLIIVWMERDARVHGISHIPYVLLTLALGSVGPLLYLMRRTRREHSASLAVGSESSAAAR